MIANIDLQSIITYNPGTALLNFTQKTKTLSLLRFLTILKELPHHKKNKSCFLLSGLYNF
jgi:hypothetical protein